MNERPITVDAPGQKRGIFIIGRHDDAVALESAEVIGQGQ
jgi:hypothetical protein